MRIISQNGKFDAPYEQCVITRDSNIIHCAVIGGKQFVAGEYESAEKAQKAMKMLHRKYTDGVYMCCIAHNEYVAQPEIFRFPSDDEFEVE